MVIKDYFKQISAVLKSVLSGGNFISALNTWAVVTVTY